MVRHKVTVHHSNRYDWSFTFILLGMSQKWDLFHKVMSTVVGLNDKLDFFCQEGLNNNLFNELSPWLFDRYSYSISSYQSWWMISYLILLVISRKQEGLFFQLSVYSKAMSHNLIPVSRNVEMISYLVNVVCCFIDRYSYATSFYRP